MSFITDFGKALGYHWHDSKMHTSQEYRRSSLALDRESRKALSKVITQFSKIEPNSGKSFGKIFHDLNSPEWQLFMDYAPDDLIKNKKSEWGIENKPKEKPASAPIDTTDIVNNNDATIEPRT